MRTYLTNSPQAATRLLAMVLVSDGNYALAEIRALDQLEASRRLGLTAEEIKSVIDQFCLDLLNAHHGEWTGSAQMDPSTRQALFNEVQDPALRREVLQLSRDLALADGHLADGEMAMLDAMERSWRGESAELGR